MAKVNLRKKPHIEVTFYLDVSNPDNPQIVFETPNPIPEHMITITSKWARPNFLLSNIINMNSYSEKIINGQLQRYFDVQALVWARIRVLLKEWNLQDFDSELKLEFENSIDSKDVKILSAKTMALIGEIDPPSIINYMYNKALEKIFPEETALLNTSAKSEDENEKNAVKEG